jgi:hypothetical protein
MAEAMLPSDEVIPPTMLLSTEPMLLRIDEPLERTLLTREAAELVSTEVVWAATRAGTARRT